MKAILLIALSLSASPVFAEIYKYLDENGKVVFSDKKNPSGREELIELAPPTSVGAKDPAPIRLVKPLGRPLVNAEPEEDLYSSLKILSPSAEASVRANNGNVTIKVASEPPLDVGIGDVVRLYLDGEPVAQGASMNIALDNLDRGEHKIWVELLNEEGEELIKTAEQKFYLQRASVLFKNRVQRGN